VESLSRQLRESDRMREQALDVSRQHQRETASRIVEFSTKNSQMSSEIVQLQEQIINLRSAKELVSGDLKSVQSERDEARAQVHAPRYPPGTVT
jgi:SMC interacting uncharacterized protein involved in chromosome segregation